MQMKKNNVKARTTLLLSLPDEHQLRFSKYKTAKELWAAILKTFSGNEAIKKRKKNLLKQNDLDTMSLDDLYNHLKVYEAEVQTKSNSQNMAFISSSKNSSGKEDSNIPCVSTASTTFPIGSVNVATICQDTASAYIASQPSPTVESTLAEGQIKDSSTFEDVASLNPPKPFVKFVKPKDSQPEEDKFVLCSGFS
nr:hypothetical protein [Tanacetum cinerariifolium]